MNLKRTIVAVLVLTIVMTFSFTGMAFGNTTYTNATGTITADNGANIRSGAGTSYGYSMPNHKAALYRKGSPQRSSYL